MTNFEQFWSIWPVSTSAKGASLIASSGGRSIIVIAVLTK
jgi:hypothetical protein